MAKIAKRVAKVPRRHRPNKAYGLGEALKLLKDRASAKFDETIEVAMNLGVDPRHADQMVRGVVNLPNGTGRTVRVAVFARAPRPTKPRPPAPTSSVRKTWSRSSRRARSTSIAASRPRT